MARKKIHLNLRRHPKTGFWEAYSRDDKLVAAGHTMRALRARMKELYGDDNEVVETIAFDGTVQQSLTNLTALTNQVRDLTVKLRAERLRVAHLLLVECAIGQTEAADLMGIKQSFLAKILKDESERRVAQEDE